MTKLTLSKLSFSWKMLLTGYVLVLVSGYLAAVMNTILAVGIEPAAIADHYGDKSLTPTEQVTLESQGFVEKEFSLDEPEEDEPGHEMHAMGDDSITPQAMAQISHVHLFGFALILISIGGLTCLTALPEAAKTILVSLLFISFLSDIGSLNLTRFVSDGFAWLTMLSGVLIGICLAVMTSSVLWELWLKPTKD
jgi:hypothetical protein